MITGLTINHGKNPISNLNTNTWEYRVQAILKSPIDNAFVLHDNMYLTPWGT